MRRIGSKFLFSAIISMALAGGIAAQDRPPTGPPAGGQRPGGAGTGASQDPQPYDKVITDDAKTKDGVFKVHQIKDKFFYEIPKNEMGKEFLWVTQIARTTLGVGYADRHWQSRRSLGKTQ